ncbi:uncharacterized protein LOC135500577 [Lineus longissimus]|uniref:uncharacterized protein LOC135500577 n=1 Tax=Lineus longissimus TaxID=88925 RepID=UPI002B4C6FEB
MAHELAPPSYRAAVGAEKRRADNTYEIRSFSDPFGLVKQPPIYTRSQSTPERSRLQEYSERSRPSRNRRLRDVTIDEDEVFESPNEETRGQSLKHGRHSYRPERAQSLRHDVRPRQADRRQYERSRKSHEDLRRINDDRQRKSFEDLRQVDEHQRKSFDDLRRTKWSNEDLSQPSPRSRSRTYSAGYESLKSASDDIRNGSPTKSSMAESQWKTPNAVNRSLSSPGGSQYSLSRAPKGNPLKSTSGDSRQSLGSSCNGTGTLRSSSDDSPYHFGNTSNENGSAFNSSSSGDSRYSHGTNSPNDGSTQPGDYRHLLGNATNHTPFHPYLSEEWQAQSGHPSSLELEASDTQTDGYSSYASTLEKVLKPDRKSVNNNFEYDDSRYGAWGTSGSLEKTYQKPKIQDKPVNPVKPLIPLKPQKGLTGPASPSVLKGAYRIDNKLSTPVKDAGPEFVCDYDPIKTALHVQLPERLDSDPLKVYTQFQTSQAVKSRDGIIFDPAKLQTQLSETGSETGQSGTLRSNATCASRASNATTKSLEHYRQDYRNLDFLRSVGGERHSLTSSDDSVKVASDCALANVERIAERNRNNDIKRSRIKRLGCGLAQIVIGLLLIANAVFIFLNKSPGWFTCAGFWAGLFAAIGGSLGVLTHCKSKDVYVSSMIGITMFNICVIYLGTFCIGLSFGLVQMEKGGIHRWLDALNFVYIVLSLFGIVASVLQMSPIEKQGELRELECAKCFVDWKALETKAPSIDRTPSTSSSQGSQERDGYRNYGYESSNYGDAVTTV